MHKMRFKILLAVLALLMGCIGSSQTREYKIDGVIYVKDAQVPIADAQIAITAGPKNFAIRSGMDGRFSITLRTALKSVKLAVEYAYFQPYHGTIKLGVDKELSLLIELSPENEGYSLVAGRIDYALPEVPPVSLEACCDAAFEPAWFEPQEELAEVIVEPYTYSEAVAREIGRAIEADGFTLYPEAGIIVYRKPEKLTIEEFASSAAAHPLVKTAGINYPVYPLAAAAAEEQLIISPNDPGYAHQWNLAAVYLPFAWPQVGSGAKVRIAVLDTLVDTGHPDLQQNLNLEEAYNVVRQSRDVSDYPGRITQAPYSHGTHVIGIIGATTDNAEGVAGVAWGINVEIIPIVVLDENNRGALSNVIAGIQKAIDLDVDIINMSLGVSLRNPDQHPLYEKIREADVAGIIMVASAGNDNQLVYPAGYPEVIAAGATTYEHQIAEFSAKDGVALFAPGGSHTESEPAIYSTDLVGPSAGGYSFARGTSMAAPHIAGIAALVKSTYPNITKSEVEDLLWNTGIVLDPAQPYQRIVNAYAAITETPLSSAVLCFIDHTTGAVHQAEFDQDRHFQRLLPPGLYQVAAHIDSNQDQAVNIGEWYYQSEVLVELGQHIVDLDIRLDIFQ
ncbi:MAG: S8 family serine peptidase [Firmicutes bacterium]|mgnify:FL=1|jgi:subtilisin family serine protease|nr:S8 family serine peptidase [Bacillota bacterium]